MPLNATRIAAAIAVLTGWGALACPAAVKDSFDTYATGPLSEVSGGKWRTWQGSSTDTLVATGGLSAPNAMRHDGLNTPDVVTYTAGNLLGHSGDVVRLSFDVFVHEAGDKDIFSDVTFGSGDPYSNDIDYDSAITRIIMDRYDDQVGRVTVYIYDQDGALHGGDYGLLELAANWTVDTWHHIEVITTQVVPDMTANDPAAADGYFDILLDGVPAATHLPFGLDNPCGVNALEIWSGYGEAGDDYFMYDNIMLFGPPRKGDMNCDDAVDGFDIDPFFLALAAPDLYQQQFPDCDFMNGDINGDQAMDGFDIEPFFKLLEG
jgi:hypothetical protein